MKLHIDTMNFAQRTSYKLGRILLSSAVVLSLAGCSGLVPTDETSLVSTQAKLQGKVYGGQQPIAHASVYLYAASTSGYGTAARNLLTQSVFTGEDGTFNTTAYSCTAGQQLYLVALGGNPGGGTNENAANMAALGDCNSVGASTFVNLNEITTVASVFALSQFMNGYSSVGTSSTNITGLMNAFALVKNLTDLATGSSTGSTLPGGAVAPVAKVNTMADALAECINSTGGHAGDNGSACGTLFTLATSPGGVAPTNTIDATLSIARNPALNAALIYNTVHLDSPFSPRLTNAPNDWTLSISYTGAGLNNPAAVAVDSSGSIWAANGSAVASKLSATGVPAAANGFADPSLYESYGVAVDAQDNAWITNAESGGGVNGGLGTVTKLNPSGQVLSGTGFRAGGIYFPEAVAITPAGNVWIAEYGDATATLLAPDGSSLSGTAGYSSYALGYTDAVAVDSSGNGWFATDLGTAEVTTAGAVTPYRCCQDASSGVAIDRSGNVWLSDYSASKLTEVSPSGVTLQQISSAGGLAYPQGIAIDGSGNVWVTDFQTDAISGFTAGANAVSNALSPSSGFGTDAHLAQPAGLAIDAAGNLWVANSAGNSLTQFIGLATPVKTPQIGPPNRP